MTPLFETRLRLGRDPRGLAEFNALADELPKLEHPARPDVDWVKVEHECLALLESNGAELQTVAAYALAISRRRGLAGMREGLVLLEALCLQWAELWPRRATHRLEVLAWLFVQWQSLLRSLRPYDSDPALVADVQARLVRLHGLLAACCGTDIPALQGLCQQLAHPVERCQPGAGGGGLTALGSPLAWPAVAPLPAPSVVILPSVTGLPWRPRRRWPGWVTGVALAASVTVAVLGLVWWGQLEPMPAGPVLAHPVKLQSLWLFDADSASLRPDASPALLKALLDIREQQPGRLIMISGHTDASGAEQRNLLLSLQRAQVVRDWLQSMGNFASDCFVVQGQGSTQPLVGEGMPAGQGINRRVDISLLAVPGSCPAAPLT